MQVEWDEAKNLENIRKHRIDFADVPDMFDGSILLSLMRVLTMAKIVGSESAFYETVLRLLSGQNGMMM